MSSNHYAYIQNWSLRTNISLGKSRTKNKSFFAAPLNQDSREFLNTNLLLDSVPEIMFGKTGYSDLSGGNLALVLRIKKTDYAVIILNSGFYSRFYDTEKIISEIKRN